MGDADGEAADAVEAGDVGVEDPVGLVERGDIEFSEGVLLDEEVVGHHPEAETDTDAVVACHAEDVDEAFAVGVAVLP